MTLHTVGPVFVGSGRTFNKKEYIYLRDKGKVLIPNESLFFQELQKRGLENKYTEYLLAGDKNEISKLDLRRWLEKNRISINDYEKWIRYELDCGDFLQDRGTITISEFQKDTYGQPYVPGTTIKGMLRTILLTAQLLKEPSASKNQIRQEIVRQAKISDKRMRYLNNQVKKLEQSVFYTLNRTDEKGKHVLGAVNDCMSGLIVSDSRPLELNDLVLCQKKDENIEGRQHSLNILKESVKPERDINFKLTIDTNICPFSIEDIMDSVNLFAENYYEVFLSKFRNVDFPERNTVWLGGGTGFFTKTVTYPLLGENQGVKTTVDILSQTLSRKTFEDHKHSDDYRLGISPHILKCTQYKGKKYQVGECRLIVAKDI